MDRTLITFTLIFFLSFAVFTTIIVFNKSVSKYIKAKEDFAPSGQNSIIIAWPLTIKADGKEETSVTVFVRSGTNKPVANKTVRVTSSLGQVRESEMVSNKEGMAVFHLTSNQTGVAELLSYVDNTIPVSQKITVKFE